MISESNEVATKNSPLLVVAAWMVVAIPALWGISMTVRTSVKLFQPTVNPIVSAPVQPATIPK
jgi:hypothetical protein